MKTNRTERVVSHGAGKGDADRTSNPRQYREHMKDVFFPRNWATSDGFRLCGRKYVKTYLTNVTTKPKVTDHEIH